MNNTALVRIKKEYDLIRNDPSENFNAYPIKDDLFTWHFTIRGADETDFENGVYHGVIKLPTSYPLKPPNIMFTNPNGRFDTNVDVCLSVTKFHREEWQAAWTIRTMLEAIIAFFPIKEDHDAIGAIDYPPEARKKLALQSRKWKCDICGPIIELIPEKKPKVVVEKAESEKDDNKSDNESNNNINEKVDNPNENKIVKREKNTKHKKVELDRKSLLSNIEGVIFEDVNEYAENEEEMELNIKRHQTDLMDEKTISNENLVFIRELNNEIKLDNLNLNNVNNNINIDKNMNVVSSKIESENELRRSQSDTTNPDINFSDYLRRLRQSQFESGEEEPKPKEQLFLTNSNQNEKKDNLIKIDNKRNIMQIEDTYSNSNADPDADEQEINFKNNKIEIKTDKLPLNGNNLIQNQNQVFTKQNSPMKETKYETKNMFKEHTKEEHEFYDIMHTIKFHISNNNEEILKDLYEGKNSELNTGIKKDRETIIEDLLKKILEKELEKKNKNKTKVVMGSTKEKEEKQNINDMLDLFSGKEKIESLIKQKNNALKYITRKTYKDSKTKSLRVVNIIMAISILIIFGTYYYSRNYV